MPTKLSTEPSVRYFDVDDVVIKVVSNGKVVSGFVVRTNAPYPPAKALSDGRVITKKEADLTLKRGYASNTLVGKNLKRYLKKLKQKRQ